MHTRICPTAGSRLKNIFRSLVIFFVASVVLTTGRAQVNIEKTEGGNTYAMGANVRIAAPVTGDLLAAGGRISVGQEVGADAAIVGGAIELRAPVRQDVRAAGGTVNIESDIDGELVAAGGTITLTNTANIARSALLSGGQVIVEGRIGKGAKIYAGTIHISGQIDGNTRLYGNEIKLLPGAKIIGDLSYASPNALSQDQTAQVSGKITREKTPEGWQSRATGKSSFPWFHLLFILSMLTAGALLYFLFPNAVSGAEEVIKEHPAKSFLVGLALLFTIPPAAILLMITIIGIPVAFILLLLYPLCLLLGYLAAAFFIGRKISTAMKQPATLSTGRRILFLLLALVILAIVGMLPFIGGLIVFCVLVTGLGAWAIWLYTRHRHLRAQPTS